MKSENLDRVLKIIRTLYATFYAVFGRSAQISFRGTEKGNVQIGETVKNESQESTEFVVRN